MFESPRPRKSELNVAALVAHAVAGVTTPGIRPYLIGGMGYYHIAPAKVPNPFGGYSGIEIRPGESGLGANAGVGMDFSVHLPGFEPVEAGLVARNHTLFSGDPRAGFVPVALTLRLF
jgi:hypothetical protein